ncbi:MAG: type VI secretion system protein TssA [Rhodospirillales bacterium]|nr:type VI secretion system protein TssA [Rhodospirillales bacterium]
MPPFDTDTLLAAVSDDLPAGPDLEFDADFGALERAAQGKPEQQFGSTIIAAEEPDWKGVAAQASALLERTRDLRVLAHLAVARLHLSGLPAYAEVLAATHALLGARWETVHPQLDPEEDNDPTLRANALLRIAHPGLVLKRLRGLPLAGSPRLGQYSWRDAAIATGLIDGDGEAEKPSESTIRAAFQDSDPARLAVLRDAAVQAAEAATGMGAVFDARAGFGTGPELTELVKLLREIGRTIERYAILGEPGAAPVAPAAEDVAAAPAADAPAEAAPARRGGPVSAAALTEVTTRADALRLLDLVCRYYQRYEPSSPLPLLIERARRLAEKDFLDILRDLAPDGLMQAQTIIGNRDE